MQASLETVAGDDVADRQREEDEADGQHGDVQHWMLLATGDAANSLGAALDAGQSGMNAFYSRWRLRATERV